MRTLRAVLSQRGYVALATLTLTLAVGANLVVFSVVNAIWLRPDPVPDAARLVMVLGDDSNSGSTDSYSISEFGLEFLLGSSGAFAGVAGQVLTSGGPDAAFKAQVVFHDVGHALETIGVTPEYFSVLGLSVRGRDFAKEDNGLGAEPVAIISERLWRDDFSSRPEVIGALAPASPFPIRIIGVAPRGFEGARLGEHADVWIPSNLTLRAAPIAAQNVVIQGGPPLVALARLRGGLTLVEADRVVAEHLVSRHSVTKLRAVPLRQIFGSPDSRTIVIREETVLRVVSASAALVLLAGCVTLMALVLVHYERRRQELSVRVALGATRARLTGQLAAELGWLVAAGTTGAVLVARWGLRVLPALSLPGGVDLSRLGLAIDWRVVLAGVLITLLTLAIAALMPVARFTRPDLARGLVTTTSTGTAASQRVRRLLLAVHVAATMVLLVAAGLFVRTVIYGFTQGPGFDADRTLFIRLQTSAPYTSPARDLRAAFGTIDALSAERLAAEHRLVESLQTLPGIEIVAMGAAPLDPDLARQMLNPQKVTVGSDIHELRFVGTSVDPNYLNALGVPILAGRAFTDADAEAQPVIVTASLARLIWPAGDPIGQVVELGSKRTVIGVIPDVAFGSFSLPHSSALLSPTTLDRHARSHDLALTIRTSQPDTQIEPVRGVIAGAFPDAPYVDLATGRQVIARDLGRERLGAWFFSGFGLVALALGIGGVFGLVAYLAESRRREFGVRIALGATPRDLLRQAVGVGLGPVILGGVTGLMSASLLVRFAASFLVGVSHLDPLTYAGAAVLMTGCAALAGLVAAWRVRRLSPMDALRAE
jgi:putative ABC transport system permease protein